MTIMDGHKHYYQKIGHYKFGQATSDPTWPILCGRIVTKLNGRNSNLARSMFLVLDGPSPIIWPFYFFSHYNYAQQYGPTPIFQSH
jgi:hypothetical protein